MIVRALMVSPSIVTQQGPCTAIAGPICKSELGKLEAQGFYVIKYVEVQFHSRLRLSGVGKTLKWALLIAVQNSLPPDR